MCARKGFPSCVSHLSQNPPPNFFFPPLHTFPCSFYFLRGRERKERNNEGLFSPLFNLLFFFNSPFPTLFARRGRVALSGIFVERVLEKWGKKRVGFLGGEARFFFGGVGTSTHFLDESIEEEKRHLGLQEGNFFGLHFFFPRLPHLISVLWRGAAFLPNK